MKTNTTNILQIVKCYKLQFDMLGHAVVNGVITTDRAIYRSLLRSGKPAFKATYTSDRTYQTIDLYKTFFSNSPRKKNNPSNKQLIHCALKMDLGFKPNKHYKAVIAIAKNLLKHKYLVLYYLPDGILLDDTYNNRKYYYHGDRVYRLINGKCIAYD